MDFKTRVDIKPSGFKINYDSPVLLLGSCFADEIGGQFFRGKMDCMVNPFGVMYNPLSTAQVINIIMHSRKFSEEDLHYYNNKYLSFYHDTGFSSSSKNEILKAINDSVINGHKQLARSKFLFITFGTAWVYRRKEDKNLVANCHKIPASEFYRELLKPEMIIEKYKKTVNELQEFNKNLRIVFTISPVRHLKDGAHGNQISKSVLQLSVNELQNLTGNTDYFPSYEIVLDELRDYRFYNKDMVHPSDTAIEYIWERFSDTFFTDDTKKLYGRVSKITEALNHRIMNYDEQEIAKFRAAMLDKIYHLTKEFPFLNLNTEKQYFEDLR